MGGASSRSITGSRRRAEDCRSPQWSQLYARHVECRSSSRRHEPVVPPRIAFCADVVGKSRRSGIYIIFRRVVHRAVECRQSVCARPAVSGRRLSAIAGKCALGIIGYRGPDGVGLDGVARSIPDIGVHKISVDQRQRNHGMLGEQAHHAPAHGVERRQDQSPDDRIPRASRQHNTALHSQPG